MIILACSFGFVLIIFIFLFFLDIFDSLNKRLTLRRLIGGSPILNVMRNTFQNIC